MQETIALIIKSKRAYLKSTQGLASQLSGMGSVSNKLGNFAGQAFGGYSLNMNGKNSNQDFDFGAKLNINQKF